MTAMIPCRNPRLCGVKSHYPNTESKCQATKRPGASSPALSFDSRAPLGSRVEPVAPLTEVPDTDKEIEDYIKSVNPNADPYSVAYATCEELGIEVGAGENPVTNLRWELEYSHKPQQGLNRLADLAQSERNAIDPNGYLLTSNGTRVRIDRETHKRVTEKLSKEFDPKTIKNPPQISSRNRGSGVTAATVIFPGHNIKVRVFDQAESPKEEVASGELFPVSTKDDPFVELSPRQRQNRLNKVFDEIGPDRQESERYLRRLLAEVRTQHDRETRRFLPKEDA